MLATVCTTNMAAWANESGILRKNKSNDNVDELLVFGYACKLFRDDDKAAYIDKGNHLIPWMGEDSLKIDRYDGRGALSDLAPYEASCEGYDAMRWLGLNESDRKIEQMCDKERYYSLRVNEEEEDLYKEEERKRQTQTAKEFQYSYDVPRENEEAEGVPTVEEEDEVFVPTPQLDVPVDVNIPKTVKENARIEKTAMFVHKQGLQMEILIKAKQSDNPQFGFLNQGHELYKYYRHVLNAIKNGRYQIGPVDKPEETSKEISEETSTYEGHYLHPSLVTTSVVPQPEISVPYKPSPNCTYSQLVNRIQGNNNNQATPTPSGQSEETTQQTPVEMTAEQQQYYQYYYSAQYYEYYKQLAQTYQQNGQNVQPPDLQDLDPSIQAYIQQMAYAQYLQNHQQQSNINPYAQIVSNVSAKDANAVVTTQPQEPKTKAEESVKKPLLSIVQYGSDSDDESDKEEDLPMPTGDTQIVIDKMASYVAKNGDQFEEIVRSKGDPRFEFLNQNHQFYKYYRQKLKGLTMNDKPEKTAAQPQKVQKKEKKVITPVSFSIKKPKEEPPKDIKSALPMEESDENEEEITEEVATPPQPPSESPPVIEDPPPPPPPPPPSPPKSPEAPEEVTVVNGAVLDADDPLLDMIDLTDDYEERKDAKRVEDKLKDKLAAAARERMVSVARDRALQLERKKKAEAFLRLKSAEQQSRTVEEKPRKNEKDKRSSRESSTSRSNKKKKHKRRHSRDSSRRKKSKRKRRSSSSSSSPHQ